MNIPIKEWLWPNIPTFLTTLGVVFVMYLLFKKYLFKPMRKFLNKRSNIIAKEIEESKTNQIESEKILEQSKNEFKVNIIKSKEYSQKILQKAKDESEQLTKDQKLEILNWKNEQKEKIKQESLKAKRLLYKEVANLSIEASKKILDKEIDDKIYNKLVDDFIKKEQKHD